MCDVAWVRLASQSYGPLETHSKFITFFHCLIVCEHVCWCPYVSNCYVHQRRYRYTVIFLCRLNFYFFLFSTNSLFTDPYVPLFLYVSISISLCTSLSLTPYTLFFVEVFHLNAHHLCFRLFFPFNSISFHYLLTLVSCTLPRSSYSFFLFQFSIFFSLPLSTHCFSLSKIFGHVPVPQFSCLQHLTRFDSKRHSSRLNRKVWLPFPILLPATPFAFLLTSHNSCAPTASHPIAPAPCTAYASTSCFIPYAAKLPKNMPRTTKHRYGWFEPVYAALSWKGSFFLQQLPPLFF